MKSLRDFYFMRAAARQRLIVKTDFIDKLKCPPAQYTL